MLSSLAFLFAAVTGQSASRYSFSPVATPANFLNDLDCVVNITANNAPPIPAATDCHKYTFISARGTGEPQFQAVSTTYIYPAILAAIPGGVYYELQYPADTTNNSALAGINNLTNYIIQKQAACPSEKIVLFGYSQGALVAHGALVATEIDPTGIAAVLLQGDPLYNIGQPYSAGTSNSSGTSAGRYGLARGIPCPYVYKTLNLCNENDFVCAASGDVVGHVSLVMDVTDDPGELFDQYRRPPVDDYLCNVKVDFSAQYVQ